MLINCFIHNRKCTYYKCVNINVFIKKFINYVHKYHSTNDNFRLETCTLEAL